MTEDEPKWPKRKRSFFVKNAATKAPSGWESVRGAAHGTVWWKRRSVLQVDTLTEEPKEKQVAQFQ